MVSVVLLVLERRLRGEDLRSDSSLELGLGDFVVDWMIFECLLRIVVVLFVGLVCEF